VPLGRVFLLLVFVGNRFRNSHVESGAFVMDSGHEPRDWGVDNEDRDGP
jgi:hypothetical protein